MTTRLAARRASSRALCAIAIFVLAGFPFAPTALADGWGAFPGLDDDSPVVDRPPARHSPALAALPAGGSSLARRPEWPGAAAPAPSTLALRAPPTA